MNTTIAAFAQLLRSKKGVAILKCESRTPNSVIRFKNSDDEFESKIKEALEDELDAECFIMGAFSHDHGYQIDLNIKVKQDGDYWREKCTLIYANLY